MYSTCPCRKYALCVNDKLEVYKFRMYVILLESSNINIQVVLERKLYCTLRVVVVEERRPAISCSDKTIDTTSHWVTTIPT